MNISKIKSKSIENINFLENNFNTKDFFFTLEKWSVLYHWTNKIFSYFDLKKSWKKAWNEYWSWIYLTNDFNLAKFYANASYQQTIRPKEDYELELDFFKNKLNFYKNYNLWDLTKEKINENIQLYDERIKNHEIIISSIIKKWTNGIRNVMKIKNIDNLNILNISNHSNPRLKDLEIFKSYLFNSIQNKFLKDILDRTWESDYQNFSLKEKREANKLMNIIYNNFDGIKFSKKESDWEIFNIFNDKKINIEENIKF